MKRYSVLFIQFIFLSSLFAQLSPGDLSEPHANLEGLKNCTYCHEIGKKVVSERCLDCHSLLKERIQQGLGLHARTEYGNCVECHSDHQGREFNMVWWKEGIDNFEHSKTGYTLEGKHLHLDCRRCHTAENIAESQKYTSKGKDLNKTYLGLNNTCENCHLDEHRGQLDPDCLKCHDLNKWKPAPKFDHNLTEFTLIGKHLTVDCIFCHKKIEDKENRDDQSYLKYSGLRFSQCIDCHRDPHKGRLGIMCTTCHSVSGWKNVVHQNFDHNNTRYPLIGKHQMVACNKCHLPNQSLKDLRFHQCGNCHNDYHQGQFYHRQQKGACEECHTVEGFLPSTFTIELHNTGNYPLRGAHLAVPCNLCHLNKVNNSTQFRFSSTKCLACHMDPHNKEAEQYLSKNNIPRGQDDCQYCHSLESWESIDFDHNLTKFPLDGKHQFVPCKLCHNYTGTDPSISVILKVDKNKCQECHNDIHLGQFTPPGNLELDEVNANMCDNCHTTLSWTATKFNHNRDSNFKLEGAHKKLRCENCHKTESKNGIKYVHYKPIESSCSACHTKRTMVQ